MNRGRNENQPSENCAGILFFTADFHLEDCSVTLTAQALQHCVMQSWL